MAAVLSPRARRDLLEAANWIAKNNPTAATGLRVAVVDAARRIGDHPQIGKLQPDLADGPIYFLPLTAFPYVLVYRLDHDPPLILRVLHGARNLPEVLRDI
jgi:toxin ParE1/3/4